MKKIFWIAAAVAGVFTAASCQKEIQKSNGSEAVVTLTVDVPESPVTKAISDAGQTDIVYYEIWNSDWSTKLYPIDADDVNYATVQNKKATVEFTLITDQTYNFIFWAQNKNCGAYDVSELKTVKINYDVLAANGNSDVFDAYYATKKIAVSGSIKETVTLYRPFAQLNFGSSKMQSLFGDVTVEETLIKVSGLATTFNTVEGIGQDAAAESVAFKANGIISSEPLKVDGVEYTWITMDYMLMEGIQSMVEVLASFDVAGVDNPVEHAIANVPLKKNFRTNILGELFTSGAALTVVIDPTFQKPDNGFTVGVPEEPAYNDETKTYSIKTAGNVLWLAIQEKDFAAGKTISFDADIDMMGQGINPINASSSQTNGTPVLGNGHKVFNFIVRETGNNSAGLFGNLKGSISDLHLENVTVEGEYKAGALVGSIYGNVTNCSAKNVTVTSVPYATNGSFDGGNHVGALVGYASENGKATYYYTGNVVDGAVVKGYRNLGGLIGTLQYGVDVNGNQIKNVYILVDQVTNYYGDKAANVGEIAGRLSADSRFIAPHDNIVENVNLYLPEWTTVNGVLTMELSGNITLFDGQPFCDNRDVDQPYVVDGNGATVKFVADDISDMSNQTNYTTFSSANNSAVLVKDITFTGEFPFMATGYWHGAPSSQQGLKFTTTLDNVKIIDAAVMNLQVSAQALFCDGETILNNCNIYGTQLSSYETASVPVYDLMTYNYSVTTLNGGKYGLVGSTSKSPQGTMVVNGAVIDTIENWYIARIASNHPNGEKRGLYINDGSKVGTINTHGSTGQWTQLHIAAGAQVDTLIFDANAVNHAKFTSEWIKIADGTVNKVIANGTEFTLAEFKAFYHL